MLWDHPSNLIVDHHGNPRSFRDPQGSIDMSRFIDRDPCARLLQPSPPTWEYATYHQFYCAVNKLITVTPAKHTSLATSKPDKLLPVSNFKQYTEMCFVMIRRSCSYLGQDTDKKHIIGLKYGISLNQPPRRKCGAKNDVVSSALNGQSQVHVNCDWPIPNITPVVCLPATPPLRVPDSVTPI